MNYILQKDYIDPDNFITRSGAKVHKCDTFYFADGGQTFTSDFVENNTEWFKPEEVERTTQMSYTQYLKNRTNETNNSDNSAGIN